MESWEKDPIGKIWERYKPEVEKLTGEPVEFTWQNGPVHVDWDKAPSGWYKLHVRRGPQDRTDVAGFTLVQLPGCCGICISTAAYVRREFCKKGLGTLLNRLRIDMARNMGYGVLMCTDVTQNVPQRKILAQNGWADVHKFRNPRTGNEVAISVTNL